MTAPAQLGTTTVSDRAVRRIVERAAEEAVPGRTGPAARGSVAVRGPRADVRLTVDLGYPAPLADTVRRVQRHVTERTRYLAGIDVTRAAVTVDTLTVRAVPVPTVPAERTGGTEQRPARGPLRRLRPRRPSGRLRSSRRGPVAVLLPAAALGCGATALDVVRVHLGHRPAAWRTAAVDWLSGHGPGDLSVVLGGAVAALLGLWLVALAVLPGRRGLLAVATPDAYPDTAIDRSALAALVRGAAGGVAGAGPVRVRVRRRSVTVRAALAFGAAEAVRDDVTAATRGVLADCLLRRPLRPRVRIRPEPTWRPPEPALPEPRAAETPEALKNPENPETSETPGAAPFVRSGGGA
ncbi:DUF6286 domain-containing Asp23/Gls24 family envelope stress response protein [Streptomyces sp. NPDC059818]|uniref:DUF6286 domain-containing Asp23/Gls24 family envelope stress response protein n=1 Tax=Streptomyces sp. NPDC059818 TaxID=3346962 RepID=UPI0036543C1E